MTSAIEKHPLSPFLPINAKVLMLGSFPPARKRWCMNFFYPNWQNDMWRIFGYLFYEDKEHFLSVEEKRFKQGELEHFLIEKGIALYDTAVAVNRLKENASDKFLEIIEVAPLKELLVTLSACEVVIVTGEKALEIFSQYFGIEEKLKMGESCIFSFEGREMQLYRMPSSSRAYPLSVEKKAQYYKVPLSIVGLLS